MLNLYDVVILMSPAIIVSALRLQVVAALCITERGSPASGIELSGLIYSQHIWRNIDASPSVDYEINLVKKPLGSNTTSGSHGLPQYVPVLQKV
jgi:hypothetical protein